MCVLTSAVRSWILTHNHGEWLKKPTYLQRTHPARFQVKVWGPGAPCAMPCESPLHKQPMESMFRTALQGTVTT
ncbi:hypothetical protein GCM10007108_04410 [Thermogymnomonas acidicola]|uniref:Uncharacterized protein n=1 Tax=Thermogymnomonas acidicola TaxID=399579 RepID=A0AA37BQF0_9ARCH|nr:hypothetical protein GCM10007108_04410 [Thermogymnomonas acidicola]